MHGKLDDRGADLYVSHTMFALMQYDFFAHFASYIGLDHSFLLLNTQSYNEGIALWTRNNLEKINSEKSSYMVHSRKKENFVTRFT